MIEYKLAKERAEVILDDTNATTEYVGTKDEYESGMCRYWRDDELDYRCAREITRTVPAHVNEDTGEITVDWGSINSYEKTGGYQAVHQWLRYHYGKADHCECPGCKGESRKFEYALKKGSKHKHDRNNYMQMCKKCHAVYDDCPRGEDSHRWKGGLPHCTECDKQLSTYNNKTGMCILCKNRAFPPWLGKKRPNHLKPKTC